MGPVAKPQSEVGGTVSQEPVIFCKLYFSDVLLKKTYFVKYNSILLVHGQVTIIFVVSVCQSVTGGDYGRQSVVGSSDY